MNEFVISSTTDNLPQVREAAGLPPELTEEEKADQHEREEIQQARRENGNGGESPKMQKRIDKLTKNWRATEERAAAAERERDELRTQLEAERKAKTNGHHLEQLDPKEQRRQSFKDNTAEAVRPLPRGPEVPPAEPDSEAATDANRAAAQGNDGGQPGQDGPQNSAGTVEQMRQKYPDWDAVMENAQKVGLRIPDEAANALIGIANFGDVSYFLASNPELCKHLNAMRPQQAREEIFRIGQAVAETLDPQYAQSVREFRSKLKAEDVQEMRQAIQQSGAGLDVPTSVLKAIVELENGPAVLKHVLKNQDVRERIRGMSQARAAAELGRIETQLETNGRPRLPVSNAPPPIRPLGGHSTPGPVNLDEADYQTFKREREKQIKAWRQGMSR